MATNYTEKYTTINGQRALPYLLNPSMKPLFFGGVQAFSCKPTLNREAHGEFGAKGDVIALVDYKDVTGSIDTKDLGARDKVNMLITGTDPNDTTVTQGVDWADVEKVHFFMNYLDKDRKKIIKSKFVYSVDFQPDYTANLEGVETSRYDYTGLRGVEFPNDEVVYKGFKAQGAVTTIDLGEKTLEFEKDFLKHKKVLVVLVNGVEVDEKVVVASEDATSQNTILTFATSLIADDFVQVLYLRKGGTVLYTAPEDNETTAGTATPVTPVTPVTPTRDVTNVLKAYAVANDKVVVEFNVSLDTLSGFQGSPFSVDGVTCTNATINGTYIVLEVPTGTITADTAGVAVAFTPDAGNPFKDDAGNVFDVAMNFNTIAIPANPITI